MARFFIGKILNIFPERKEFLFSFTKEVFMMRSDVCRKACVQYADLIKVVAKLEETEDKTEEEKMGVKKKNLSCETKAKY